MYPGTFYTTAYGEDYAELRDNAEKAIRDLGGHWIITDLTIHKKGPMAHYIADVTAEALCTMGD